MLNVNKLDLSGFQYSSDNVFVKSVAGNISYGEFFSKVNNLSDYFRRLGICEKSKIALIYPSSLEFIIAFFAAIKIGATIIPLNLRLPKAQLIDQIEFLNCDFIIAQNAETNVNGVITISDIERFVDTEHAIIDDNDLFSPSSLINEKATICIFTSGSSGKHKAVCHSVIKYFYSALGSNANISLQACDLWLLSLPLYHVGGLSCMFRAMLVGASIAIAGNPGDPIQDLIITRATHVSLVPTQLFRIATVAAVRELNLKAVLIGGGPVWKELIDSVAQLHFQIYFSYGSTEMCSQITTTSGYYTEGYIHSGKTIPYRKVKIAPNGEILVGGETLFDGYLTKNGLERNLVDGEYFATGDAGELTNSGELIIRGRMDNMFISGGENIYPEEIEKALSGLEYILEAVVIPVKSAEFGSRPVAFIKTDYETQLDSNTIKRDLKSKIASFKIPDKFLPFPDDYAQTGIKANRAFLRDWAEKNLR